MVFNTIRNYLSEFRKTQLAEWKIFQSQYPDSHEPHPPDPDTDYIRLQSGYHHRDIEAQLTDEYKQHYADTYHGFAESDQIKGQPFEFYMDITPDQIPESRLPAPGISVLPVRLHPDQVVSATEQVPETGYEIHPLLRYLITARYPQYMTHIHKYVRPLGTTDATFEDFNREQIEYPPVPTDVTNRILPLLCYIIYALPFLPLHYVDTFFIKMPLSTGTSYFYRHSYELKTRRLLPPPRIRRKRNLQRLLFQRFYRMGPHRHPPNKRIRPPLLSRKPHPATDPLTPQILLHRTRDHALYPQSHLRPRW